MLFTVVVGLVLWLLDRRQKRKTSPAPDGEKGEEGATQENSDDKECCGLHITCEKDSLSPFTTEAEYYDDEELDRFRGRTPDSYTDEETEEFRDVMLTMRPEEIAGWARSLQIRQVALPGIVKEELLMIVAEQRASKNTLSNTHE